MIFSTAIVASSAAVDRGAEPADRGAEPADRGAEPADRGAEPSDRGAEPADPELFSVSGSLADVDLPSPRDHEPEVGSYTSGAVSDRHHGPLRRRRCKTRVPKEAGCLWVSVWKLKAVCGPQHDEPEVKLSFHVWRDQYRKLFVFGV